jgi:hypothetical protein
MTNIFKLTKAQLVSVIEQQQEDKFSILKAELGLPYHTDQEWIDFINSLLAGVEEAKVCGECEKVKEDLKRLTAFANRCH